MTKKKLVQAFSVTYSKKLCTKRRNIKESKSKNETFQNQVTDFQVRINLIKKHLTTLQNLILTQPTNKNLIELTNNAQLINH